MNIYEIAAFYALIYFIGVAILVWAIRRAQPLQTVDGRTEAAPGGITAVPEILRAARHSSDLTDEPPVTAKYELLIETCTDPMLWYSSLIGQRVPYLGSWNIEKCYKSREPAGYTNIIHWKDARMVATEVEA